MLRLFLLLIVLLTGCAKSLVPGHYRHNAYVTDRGKIWHVHVVDAYRVGIECIGMPLPGIIHGCTIPFKRGGHGKAYMIDSFAAAYHECGHLRAFGNGSTSDTEWLKDLLYGHLLSTGIFLLTAAFPAPHLPCGESAIYTGLPGIGSPTGGRLLTAEEWKEYVKEGK